MVCLHLPHDGIKAAKVKKKLPSPTTATHFLSGRARNWFASDAVQPSVIDFSHGDHNGVAEFLCVALANLATGFVCRIDDINPRNTCEEILLWLTLNDVWKKEGLHEVQHARETAIVKKKDILFLQAESCFIFRIQLPLNWKKNNANQTEDEGGKGGDYIRFHLLRDVLFEFVFSLWQKAHLTLVESAVKGRGENDLRNISRK